MILWGALGAVVVLYAIIEWVYVKYWDAKLEVNAYLPAENLHEGEIACVREVIINDKFLPLPTLETFFQLEKGLRYTSDDNAALSDKLYRRDVFAVGMKRKISRTFELRCEKRGYYTLEGIEMMSSDIFLQQKFLGKRRVFSSFHVYPRRVRSEQIALPYQRIMGELLVHKKLESDPFSFGGMRDYTSTDPMNTINWKASAKAQDLMVNLYDSSVDQQVTILLDTAEQTGSFASSLNEESIRIAAALAERLLHQGVEVTLLGNGQDCCNAQRLCLQNLKGQGTTLLKEHLARLKLGQEQPISQLFAECPQDAFTVLISKNQALQEGLKAQLQDFVWVLPYRAALPQITNGLSAHCVLWEYNTGNLNEG
ncbi:MAG: DUF58 domain-containing protein [Faecalibacterium sp.]